MERRRALAVLVHGGSATVAAVVGVPTLIYAFSAGTQSSAEALWCTIGPQQEFTKGTIRAASVEVMPTPLAHSPLQPGVYVWRKEEDDFVVFSRSCTDLGCPVTFDHGSECFFCPCHGGIFSKEGDPMAGPPDRPLYRYRTRVVDGVLQVDLYSVPPIA